MKIHLGFELQTGHPVELPLHHLVTCGVTQSSGKTTTLEALITRSGLRAVVFLTKRGEGGFENRREIQPYFKPRIDWQYVKSLLEATMKEKMQFKEAWIIRSCEGNPKTLEDVHENVKRLEDEARAGMSKDMYRCLDAYFDIVLPEIHRTKFSTDLKLSDDLNVMHLETMSSEVQALVIRSVLDEIYRRYKNTIVVIPECWKFIPRGRGSPVKPIINALIREGAVLGNFCYFDSQDIASIDASILKSVDIWLLGRQREVNEIKRMIDYMPIRPKPRADQIATLAIGQFVACFGHEVKTVYVQPAWMDWGRAQSVATGMLALETARSESEGSARRDRRNKRIDGHIAVCPFCEEEYSPGTVHECRNPKETKPAVSSPCESPSSLTESAIDEEVEDMGRIQELEHEVTLLKAQLNRAHEQLRDQEDVPWYQMASERERRKGASEEELPRRFPMHEHMNQAPILPSENGKIDLDEIAAAVVQRLKTKPEVLRVMVQTPHIEVEHTPVTVQEDGTSFRGRVARLIHSGWFNDPRGNKDIADKLTATGTRVIAGNIPRDLKWFVVSEFLEREGKKYIVAQGAARRITV